MDGLTYRYPAPLGGALVGMLVGIGVGIVIGARYVRAEDLKRQMDDMQGRMRSMMDDTQSRMRGLMDETRSQLEGVWSSAASRAEETVVRLQKSDGQAAGEQVAEDLVAPAGGTEPKP